MVLIEIIQFDNSVHIQTAQFLPNEYSNSRLLHEWGRGGGRVPPRHRPENYLTFQKRVLCDNIGFYFKINQEPHAYILAGIGYLALT